jgi:2-hydroxychromene-2-carboxylate isomerase
MTPVFYFGAMSPYSWFAAERIGQLLPQARWRGVFAGAIFKANGRSSWGLGERRGAGIADCQARAAAHALGPMRWPQPWPTNDVTIARAMLFAQRRGVLEPFALAAMRMAFREGADLGQTPVVLEAGRRVGIDEQALQRALADPEIKDALRAATDEALAAGVFGVPTVAVGAELFWGDDRLEQASAVASRAGA